MGPLRTAIFAVGAAAAVLAWGQGGFRGPGSYEISNAQSGRVLDLDPQDRITVVAAASRGTPSQRWVITTRELGYVYIRNVQTRAGLEMVQDASGVRVICRNTQENPNQHWHIREAEGGSVMLIGISSQALEIPGAADQGDSSRRFVLRRVGGVLYDGPLSRQDPARRRGSAASESPWFDRREHTWKLAGDGACLYSETGFRGEPLCCRAGDGVADIFLETGGTFGSLKFFGRARQARVYPRTNYRGGAIRILSDEDDLSRVQPAWAKNLRGRLGSLRVE